LKPKIPEIVDYPCNLSGENLMKKNYFSSVICLLLILTMPLKIWADESPPQTLAELKLAIETIQKETHVPAIGIALVDKNGPVWITGLGLANIENKVPATADTMFRIGSVSKTFSGIAIMQLVEAEKISLNDKLRDVAPDVEFENPWGKTHPVLVAHLLEHTTGWDIHIAEYLTEAPDTTSLKEGLANHPDSRISRWAPGTRHAYSNIGAVVAARVVEHVSGLVFEDYVQKYIFDPLNMSSTTYFETDDYIKNAATLYTNEGQAEYAHMFSRPSSSINSSARDMAKFLSLFTNRGKVGDKQLLTENSISRMERGETTLGAAQDIRAGYGLTLLVESYKKDWFTPFYGHSGGLPGAITDFIYLPETQSGYVFMYNHSNGSAYYRLSEILKAYLLKDKVKPKFEAQPLPEKFRDISGYYQQINSQKSLTDLFTDFDNLVEFSVTENSLNKRYVIGGQEISYITNDKGELVSAYTGLNVVAWVNDPLAGKSLQIAGRLFKKTSALFVFGKLILLVVAILLILSSQLFLLVWIPFQLVRKPIIKSDVKFHFWPIVTSLTLVTMVLIPIMVGGDIQTLTRFPIIGLSIYVLSLLYSVTAILGLYQLFKQRDFGIRPAIYWHSAAARGAHLFVVGYLFSYSLLPFNIWY
jgi:CubicO group peptidase (beta-lactamase class C family)